MSVPLLLASRSPRRIQMLREAGFDPMVVPAGIEDSLFRIDHHVDSVPSLVISLAYFKAMQVIDGRDSLEDQPVILAADTVCSIDRTVIGKPACRQAAQEMIESFMERTHQVVTGVCILDRRTRQRHLFHDQADVHLGRIDDDVLEQYLDQEHWRGKAGAYNYSDRVDAGWPLSCDGDPTTVMGLPMVRLVPMLSHRAVARPGEPSC